NGSSAWRIPDMGNYPAIRMPYVTSEMQEGWKPYLRNLDTMVRYKADPGTEGFMHRLGGLEKDYQTSAISTNPENHQRMTDARQAKIDFIAHDIPLLNVLGDPSADLLIVGWGGTYGHLYSAVEELNAAGKKVAYVHFNYINPFPKNTEEILRHYKKVLVCELNNGQFAAHLRAKIPGVNIAQFNQVQGQPFRTIDIVEAITNELEN
ncbi:MAG: 2-oxoacid:acceptor oxidoreductase subunit alpha, partial [Bacteroidales bacterium]